MDAVFCYNCMCVADKLHLSKCDEAFITRGYTNWKNATTAFKKHEDSDCHKQAIGLSILPQQCGDIGELMHQHLKDEKKLNRDILLAILRAIRYLSRQGLALRGHESTEGNFIQVLKLQSETDDHIKS